MPCDRAHGQVPPAAPSSGPGSEYILNYDAPAEVPLPLDGAVPRHVHRVVEEAVSDVGHEPRRRVEIAFVHVALGQADVAFDWLEKALAERAWSLVLLRVDPRADPLRADPRFADLLRRIGL